MIFLEPLFRIVVSEAKYMCICSKNSDPEHLDETKIFLIVIFHVFIFRKWPNSLLEFSILERFEYLTVLMIIIPCYSGETEPIFISVSILSASYILRLFRRRIRNPLDQATYRCPIRTRDSRTRPSRFQAR